MAANFDITPGSGVTVAADDVGGVKVQRIKPQFGASGSAVDQDIGTGVAGSGTPRTAPCLQDGHIGEVGGNLGVVAASEFTRPSNTSAYSAGDAISDSTSAPTLVCTFTNVLRVSGGTGYITKLRAMTDKKDCTTKLRLHLFNDGTITPINDNAVQTLLYVNRASWLGSIDLPAMTTEDASTSTAAAAINDTVRHVVKGGANRNLYGLLETIDGFTPASGQKFYIELSVDNN